MDGTNSLLGTRMTIATITNTKPRMISSVAAKKYVAQGTVNITPISSSHYFLPTHIHSNITQPLLYYARVHMDLLIMRYYFFVFYTCEQGFEFVFRIILMLFLKPLALVCP